MSELTDTLRREHARVCRIRDVPDTVGTYYSLAADELTRLEADLAEAREWLSTGPLEDPVALIDMSIPTDAGWATGLGEFLRRTRPESARTGATDGN